MTSAPNSLAEVLTFMIDHRVEDDTIYAELEQIDVARARRLIKRLERVETATAPARRGSARAEFEGRRSRLKGELYEALVSTIVSGVRCFGIFQNVQSTTSELDILVAMTPRSLWVPALRNWGSHCICECKYHSTYVTTDWVTKLNTVLQLHGASVGILFSRKGIAPKGAGSGIRQSLQLLAASGTPRYIVCLSWSDLIDCTENGKRILKLLVTRYIEVQAGLERLGLAMGA